MASKKNIERNQSAFGLAVKFLRRSKNLKSNIFFDPLAIDLSDSILDIDNHYVATTPNFTVRLIYQQLSALKFKWTYLGTYVKNL